MRSSRYVVIYQLLLYSYFRCKMGVMSIGISALLSIVHVNSNCNQNFVIYLICFLIYFIIVFTVIRIAYLYLRLCLFQDRCLVL